MKRGTRDKATLEAIIELDKRWTPKNEAVLTELQRLQMAEMDLKERQSEINNAMQLRQATSVFQTFPRVQKNLPVKSEIPRHLFNFPSEKTPDSESTVKTPELKIVNTYKYASFFISDLKVLKNGTFVIQDNAKIKYLVVENSELKQICTIGIEEMQPGCNDMTVTDDCTVYLSECRGHDVMCVKKGMKLKRFATIAHEPHGLHAKDNETLLVGFISGVIIFNLQGRQLQKFEMDTFLCPEKLTTNLNGDICIIDRSVGDPDYMYGKIVVLGSKGELKWTYSGHGIENSSEDEFSPCCIVTTEKGNILTSESNTIHMLSKDGKFIRSFEEKQGIPSSNIVAVNNNGQLILVEMSGEISKIHIVDLINI
ncbi:uncharacterized protein LOC127733496 [Mytilus californianus]|uniref:uncharacterized protein LOC127733496 n=1 Tax=Mytilus californianus TaxID=6549 RepID=UPI0022479C72|nr:uncharacterized protein LOC127733496 [Mytilus californianus]